MDIKAGDDYLTLPEPCEEQGAWLFIYSNGNPEQNPKSYKVPIARMDFNWLSEKKAGSNISGFPTVYAIAWIEGKQRLFFWPTPDRDLFARFRYCPAMKEI